MAEKKDDTEVDYAAIAEAHRKILIENEALDPNALIEKVYQLWWRWADFELFIIEPTITPFPTPKIIPPAKTDDSKNLEFVYPIHDHGYKFITSKSEDMFSAGFSMCKIYNTIEKIIYLLIERLIQEGGGEDEEGEGGFDTSTEVQVAFSGFDLCQRKAFESIINLNYNVIVTNFEPGEWGERYLENVKRLGEKGYGYPSEAPRDGFRHAKQASPSPKQ